MSNEKNTTSDNTVGIAKKKDHKPNQEGIGRLIDSLGTVYAENAFFYYILKGLRIEETGDVPTMAVGIKRGDKVPTLFYNSEFLAGFDYKDDNKVTQHYTPTRADVAAIILHEALHLCLRHLQRRILTHNPRISNYAMDLLVNNYIAHINNKGYNGKTMGDFTIHKNQKGFEFLKDMDLEQTNYPELYDLLMKEMPKKKVGLEELEKMIANGQLQFGDHPWEDGDELELDEQAKARFEDLMKSAAKQCERNNHWGSVPGEIMRYVQDLIKPKQSWRNTLEYFLTSCRMDTTVSTWKKMSRRYGNRSPGRKADNRPSLLIGVDTSGSIGQETYDLFCSYLDYAIQYCQTVNIAFCDTQIHKSGVYEVGTREHLKPAGGGGGTMLMPIFDLGKELHVDGICLLTDGFHDQINTYNIPTIALTCPGGQPSPGIRISVPLSDK